ncbi:MAG: Lrp/AsnC family transcriptional regulator [Betaproteobacteria bacterium]|nr:Lrp/AsnC family transcriptional regulator [Betaproteobacteria bacterium]
MLDELDLRLLDSFQHGMPICEKPYEAMAATLNCGEDELICRLQRLLDERILSRIGPVFDHGVAGASTLAALAVPAQRIEEVAVLVNACPEVNHNYLREHHWNMWFVLTAADQEKLDAALKRIEQQTELEALNLPMQSAYFIDLGFPVGSDARMAV